MRLPVTTVLYAMFAWLVGCADEQENQFPVRLVDQSRDLKVTSSINLEQRQQEALKTAKMLVDTALGPSRVVGNWVAPLLTDAPLEQALEVRLVGTEARGGSTHRVVFDSDQEPDPDESYFTLETPSPLPSDLDDPKKVRALLRDHADNIRILPHGEFEDVFTLNDDTRALLVGTAINPEREDAMITVTVEALGSDASWAMIDSPSLSNQSPWIRIITAQRVLRESIVIGAPGSAELTVRLPRPASRFTTWVAAPTSTAGNQILISAEIETDGLFNYNMVAEHTLLSGPSPWVPLQIELGDRFPHTEFTIKLSASIPSDGEGEALVAFGSPVIEAYTGDSRPDVILISLDTVRADRLSLYGHEAPTSPFLESLATDAVIFDTAISPAPWTLPSHVSILSGQYPDRHGVHGSQSQISGDTPWLPEEFRDAGYRTMAFTGGGYVSPDFGFSRGFERYCTVDPAFPPAAWAETSAGKNYRNAAQKSELSRQELLALLTESPQSPLFLFVHTYAAHNNPAPPADLVAVGGSQEELQSLLRETTPAKLNQKATSLDQQSFAHSLRQARIQYDASLRVADRLVSDVVLALKESGRLSNSIVIVTSDHGEELFEHGAFGHGQSVYEEQIHVPLLILLPGADPARIENVVSTVDLAPTLRNLCNLDAGKNDPGNFLEDGHDLTSLMGGAPLHREPPLARGTRRDRVFRALRSSNVKYIREENPGAKPFHMVFSLNDDPEELKNLAAERTEDLNRFQALLQQRLGQLQALRAAGIDTELTEELEEQLRSLGYLGGE